MDDECDKLFVPHGISPAEMKDGITFEEFIMNYDKKHPVKEKLTLNKIVMRNIILDSILD